MSVQKNPPLALIGENSNKFIEKGLSENGFKVISLPCDNRLSPQVSSHADMLIFSIDDIIFCNEIYYKTHKHIFEIIESYGYKINHSDFCVSNEYPNDVSLNQAIIGKSVIGRKDVCAKNILEYIKKNDYVYCSVKQGYAKCSTLILNDKAIICADSGITSIAQTLNVKTLKIENGINEITLDGYNYGFIGGASVVFKNKVFFFGDLSLHSQGKEIAKFCKDNGFSPISLGKEKLCDIGGAIILPYINGKQPTKPLLLKEQMKAQI